MECVETHGKGLVAEGRVKRISMARPRRVRRRQSRD